jgi:prefoldin alpha subunit
MTKEEELSKYMAMMENYNEQLNTLDVQSSYLQAAIADYTKAKLTLENLKKSDERVELLLPIGGSTFISAISKDTKKVLFDVGSGIITEKSSEEAIKKIEDRMDNLQETQNKISSMIKKLQLEASEISNKAQKIMSEGKK